MFESLESSTVSTVFGFAESLMFTTAVVLGFR